MRSWFLPLCAALLALGACGLTNGTTHDFTAFSYDAESNYSSGADASAAPDGTAPGDVTSLTAASGDGQIVWSWTNPSDSDYDGAMIRRATDTAPSTTSQGMLVAFTSSGDSTYTDTGLTNSTEYFHTLFSRDAGLSYSSRAGVSTTPGTSILPDGANLNGTWAPACVVEPGGEDDTGGEFTIVILNSATEFEHKSYTDAACSDSERVSTTSSTFTIAGNKTLGSGVVVGRAGTTDSAETYTPHTQDIVDQLNGGGN